MAHDLNLEITQDPSRQYTRWPEDHGRRPLDLTVGLRLLDNDRVLVYALETAQRSPRTRSHHANLTVSASRILDLADRLRHTWRDRFVHHQPLDAYGMPDGTFPFADNIDLRPYRSDVDPLVAELADEGRYVLDTMLRGENRDLTQFRAFLLGALGRERGLRISFDSDIYLPWPMLAVEPGDSGSPWSSFLGSRHQIEQTGGSYPATGTPGATRTRAVTSINADTGLNGVGRSPDVHELLGSRSDLTVRTEWEELRKALDSPDFDEDLMYFWCHGMFVNNGARSRLAIRLSDNQLIDADLVHRIRQRHDGSKDPAFRPFVLLNACHAGVPAATTELEYLGKALIEHGADGVLGPQIEIPTVFAAEYAYAFLHRYLHGAGTAGEISLALVRHFSEELHNPLALAYSLHCGIDSRLETHPCTSPLWTSTKREDSSHRTAVIPSPATESPSISPGTSASRTG